MRKSTDMSNATDLFPLPYSVVKVSSEEKGFAASALSAYSPDTVGWQSQSNANERSDSQTLLLKIHHNNNEKCMMHAIEIISHGSWNSFNPLFAPLLPFFYGLSNLFLCDIREQNSRKDRNFDWQP